MSGLYLSFRIWPVDLKVGDVMWFCMQCFDEYRWKLQIQEAWGASVSEPRHGATAPPHSPEMYTAHVWPIRSLCSPPETNPQSFLCPHTGNNVNSLSAKLLNISITWNCVSLPRPTISKCVKICLIWDQILANLMKTFKHIFNWK